jgi:hypothetical protein
MEGHDFASAEKLGLAYVWVAQRFCVLHLGINCLRTMPQQITFIEDRIECRFFRGWLMRRGTSLFEILVWLAHLFLIRGQTEPFPSSPNISEGPESIIGSRSRELRKVRE